MTEPTVFLTGFPGFLGSALLERICAREEGPVACLVQPQHHELAQERAQRLTDRLDTPGAIQLYEGDITEPDLGLGDSRQRLSQVRECYHLAAVYDLGVEQAVAQAVNVRGTEHVLDLAQELGVEGFQYVSTCYVSGRYDGVFTEAHLQEGQTFNNQYERSKFQAEVAVQERMKAGFPATIYRPAIVVGDSQTGETDKLDGPYNLLRLLLAQPRALAGTVSFPGSSDTELNVVPRDFVVDAIAYLTRRQAATGSVYQLCDPAPLCVPAFVDALAEATGHRTVSLPTIKSVAKLAVRALDRVAVHVDPHTLDYLDHPTRYACPNTTRALAGSGIEVPPFESYAEQLVTFAQAHPEIGDEPLV